LAGFLGPFDFAQGKQADDEDKLFVAATFYLYRRDAGATVRGRPLLEGAAAEGAEDFAGGVGAGQFQVVPISAPRR